MEVILVLLVVVLVIVWLVRSTKLDKEIKFLRGRVAEAQNKIQSQLGAIGILEKEKEALNSALIDVRLENTELSRFKGIVDTESYANELRARAEREAQEIQDAAKKELYDAKDIAKQMVGNAKVEAELLRSRAETMLGNADKEVKKILEAADKQGLEIAGDAFLAFKQVDELTRTVKAMKNVIEGYGDQYLIPTYSLLDDLAEEFSHTDAGDKLKFARERTRGMVKNGSAARCEYVETNRKETAINFVLDAFNGKVDSVLSKVKKDNFGTLEQQIKDACQLVNNNGKAFKNAVITQEYLKARLEELKWAVIAQELKWQEQEEQRQIREQMREEEKARKEYERAIREAQKDEEKLKKLIEQAQKDVAVATEEQKASYEAKLQDLAMKLKLAEEKNQRALSMAQQTKSGNVYIISNIGSFGEDVFKIGMTRRLEPLDRVRELGDASVPFSFDVHAMIYSDNAPALERELHRKFLMLQLNKVNPRKEFFKVALIDIKEQVDQMGLTVKWTLAAEAKQYRESLRIAETIGKDKKKRLDWENYQLQQEAMDDEKEEEVIELNTEL